MRSSKAILGLAALGLSTLPVVAQDARFLLQADDTIIGVGLIDRLNYMEVLDTGTWLAVVEAGPDNTRDQCILRNGFLTLREGMNLPFPAGSTAFTWGSMDMASNGDIALHIGARQGTVTNDGLYWNLALVALEGQTLNVPPLAPNATITSIQSVRVTADRTIIALVELTNPPQTRARTLMRFRLDAQGNVTERTVLATKGMTLDVLGFPIDSIGSATATEYSLAINQNGDFFAPVQAIGRRVLLKNLDTIIAEENAIAPVPANPPRTYNSNAFVTSKTAINNRGDVAFTCQLTAIGSPTTDPTNFLIVKNGEKFAQSGDVIPELSTSTVGKNTPLIALTNRGDLYWRAQPTSTAGAGAAVMRNYTPIVQESITVVEGNQFSQLAGDDTFAISPEGRFLLVRGVVQSIGDAILYVDFGLVSELNGCLGLNQGTLRHLTGEPRIGQRIQFGMDDGPFVGALPLFVFSRRPLLSQAGCGASTPFGELMLGDPLSSPFVLPAWDGVNPSVFTVDLPNSLALANATIYVQGLFGNPNQPTSFRLTNALKYEIGPP
jgi:hypothetical protein